jgi:hypothetical protein
VSRCRVDKISKTYSTESGDRASRIIGRHVEMIAGGFAEKFLIGQRQPHLVILKECNNNPFINHRAFVAIFFATNARMLNQSH